MTITTTRLYQLISEKTDNATAEALTNYINEKIKEDLNERGLATKADLTAAIELSAAKLETGIARSKTSMVMWMFGFWLTQMLALAGVIFTILQQIHKPNP